MTKLLLHAESRLSHDGSSRGALQVLTFSHHIQINLSINGENNLIRLPLKFCRQLEISQVNIEYLAHCVTPYC